MGFNLIYWNSICNFHFLEDSLLEKCGKIWKNNKCGKIWKNNSSPPPPATTGLGKYRTGGYDRIGVYRVNLKGKKNHCNTILNGNQHAA